MTNPQLSRRTVVTGAGAMGIAAWLAPSLSATADTPIPVARPVGGTTMANTRQGEVLTLRFSADSGDPCIVGVEAYGHTIHFTAPRLGRTADGVRVVVRPEDAQWDAGRRGFVIAEGTIGTLSLQRLPWTPPSGTPAVEIAVDLAEGEPVTPWPIIEGWSGPDHARQREAGPAALACVLAATPYLESIVNAEGALEVIHPSWPGDPQPDPQANADLAQLYTGLHRATGDPIHEERARRTLDFLLSSQREDGGFGFPWAFGASTGHYSHPGHYPDDPNHASHEVGEPMAIITISTGLALMDAYRHFGDRAYLDGTERIAHYLLHSERGLVWLDQEQTRASIPYCTIDPIDDAGHTSAEIYNIDGSSLSVLSQYLAERPDAEAIRMGDAVAANLASLVEPDGSIVYGAANLGKPTGYASAVARGLFDWGLFRERRDLIEIGARIIGWTMQTDQPFRLAIEPLVTPMGLVDNTEHVLFNINNRASSQRPDGSWTGGSNGRTDVGNPKHLVLLLNQMDYRL